MDLKYGQTVLVSGAIRTVWFLCGFAMELTERVLRGGHSGYYVILCIVSFVRASLLYDTAHGADLMEHRV